ncbi:uncharacterized protein LOC123308463 [Coccinella septempunctata]|uniref:uncharacterized protein LOC123308463 n=1 Tax=Coccinella septempunctata TaxID=41139 RepID=UPI001D08C5D6|nr:uncharacterized protein LOC123308463 [Coccinella septempunctata]
MAKPASTIKELNVRVDMLSEELRKGIEDFKNEFLKSQSSTPAIADIGENPLDLLEAFEKRMNDAIHHIKVDIDSLRNNVNMVKKKEHNSEMKRNLCFLLIHGIPESERDIYDAVIKLCNNKIEVLLKKEDLNQCYRVGRKKTDSDKPRPIAVQFLRRWNRDAVFVNKRKLKGTNILITEMLTLENFILFKKARRTFGKSVWTLNGVIYVDLKGQKKVVNNEEDLNDILH